ncbi:hypothetical protein Tco_0895887 [Tanacetum coccineum]|uniref:Uncharacterized protein n=1 Tax=Tanacetum coccineum TaxID=301880 RepID=A0ABQ5CFW6_9ASTR
MQDVDIAYAKKDEDEGLGNQEDASKQGRKIDDIDKDAEVTLVDEGSQGRVLPYGDFDDLVFDTTILDGEEVFAGQDVVEKEVSTADPVTTASEVVTTASVEVSAATITTTTAITESTTILAPLTIPKAKRITFRDPGESTRRTKLTSIPSNIKDKGKAKMIELEKPLKMKEQIRLDEELAFKLQAEEEEQARLAREKAEKVEEANISWDNVQAMIKADMLLAKRLQAREKEELTEEEKARLFVELLEKRKKHFAALRAQEKRNKPPTKAQKKSTMSTYLKNMAGYKQSQLKNKSFAEIQKLFDKAMTRVNMFVDKDTELVKESSKKAELIKSFDREDLETLWKLVKAKHWEFKGRKRLMKRCAIGVSLTRFRIVFDIHNQSFYHSCFRFSQYNLGLYKLSKIYSIGINTQSSNIEVVCTKGDDGEVMFIELIKNNDDSSAGEPEEERSTTTEGVGAEYFGIFPTRSKLAYHKYLMCSPILSIFLRNPIITEGRPSNLKIPCNIRHVHVEKAYIDLNSPLNIMTRMMYNWIMRRKLNPRENSNRGVSKFTGRIKGMHIFIENFTYIIDFMIVKDISSIINHRLSQVVLRKPFVEISNMTHDPPEGVVRFTNRTDKVAYKMPYMIEQYNSLLNLEKEHTKSVNLRNEEDKRRGVEYVISKILGFYKECLELGPEYVTGMDYEGEVT